MASCRHHVTFRFRLPRIILLRAPVGVWPKTARGVTLDVDPDGIVLVTSIDMHETFARDQVLRTAANFLRTVDEDVPPLTIPAHLSAPSCRNRPVGYAISLGAKVSIARADERPLVVGPEPPLPVVNQRRA